MSNLLRCELVLDGPGPNESIVKVQRVDGNWEEVIAPKHFVEHGFLRTQRLGSSEGKVLVELPRESASGSWRLWVSEKSMR